MKSKKGGDSMEYKLDLRRVIQELGVTGERLAHILEISYHDMSMMIRGRKSVPDELVGKLFRIFGKSIFF